MNKMKDQEQKIIDKQYGRDAKPILIADKSIAGLIAGNKCQKSKLTAWNIFSGLKALRP
jgi:hypothetical protein